MGFLSSLGRAVGQAVAMLVLSVNLPGSHFAGDIQGLYIMAELHMSLELGTSILHMGCT